ncbi:MAG: element excision factor XisH family protein [Bacteroidota bacterium]
MPRRDTYHEHVKEAVQKDNWDVTDDPLLLSRGNVNLSTDLGAEKIITAERGLEKIAIEIKSFLRSSLVNAFHEAVGQYRNYRRVLRRNNSERVLYLAVP